MQGLLSYIFGFGENGEKYLKFIDNLKVFTFSDILKTPSNIFKRLIQNENGY